MCWNVGGTIQSVTLKNGCPINSAVGMAGLINLPLAHPTTNSLVSSAQ